ncbi:MAG: CBS domain-containing protein [Terracidiphilus sp.]
MSRAFQVARPEDTLSTTIRRLTAGHGLALIPVAESGRVVGIVSAQNLMSSVSLVAEAAPHRTRRSQLRPRRLDRNSRSRPPRITKPSISASARDRFRQTDTSGLGLSR